MVLFLQLPAEIRLQIYRELLTNKVRPLPDRQHSNQWSLFRVDYYSNSCSHGFHASILRANKPTYNEALSTFYKSIIFTIVLTKDSWEVNAPYKLLPCKARLESNLSYIAPHLENAQLFINLISYLAGEPCRGWVRRQIKDICSVLSKAPALRTLMISWPNTVDRNPLRWLRNTSATAIVNGLPESEVARPLIRHLLEPMGLLPKSVSYQMCSSPVGRQTV